MLLGMNVEMGLDLNKLIEAGAFISSPLEGQQGQKLQGKWNQRNELNKNCYSLNITCTQCEFMLIY